MLKMFQILKLLLLIVIDFPFVVLGQTYCKNEYYKNDKMDYCTFTGIKTSKVDPYFQPDSKEANVEYVLIKDSQSVMPVLTDEICNAFPNLKRFRMGIISLERIDDGALDLCTELEIFDCWYNKITELPSYLFVGSTNMKKIFFEGNPITSINGSMFKYTKKLEKLSISRSKITQIDFTKMPVLDNLWSLSLTNNDLLNLDAVIIAEKFPKLSVFQIIDNLFACPALKIILDYFKTKNINATYEFSSYRKPRNPSFKSTKIGDVDCLEREEYLKALKYNGKYFEKTFEQNHERQLNAVKLEKENNDLLNQIEIYKMENKKLKTENEEQLNKASICEKSSSENQKEYEDKLNNVTTDLNDEINTENQTIICEEKNAKTEHQLNINIIIQNRNKKNAYVNLTQLQ